MIIAVHKMTVLLFEHLIITGEPFTLEVQVLTEGDALLYASLSVLIWVSSSMLYSAFKAAPIQVSRFIHEKYNILIEDENKGE